MKLRPMNKTLVIEVEGLTYQVEEGAISKVLNDPNRKIVLPEHNTLEKVSDHAKVIRAANDCVYPYKKNQRICYKNLDTTPVWYEEDGKKYRIIKEWDVNFVYEDD
jgi:hypothetical protein